MKHLLVAAAFCLLFASFGFAKNDEINIVPKPRLVKVGNGHFTLSKNTQIYAVGKSEQKIAELLNDFLSKNYNFKLKTTKKTRKNDVIIFQPDVMRGDLHVNDNAYSLNVDSKVVTIVGNEPGIFYGLQSLLQLLPTIVAKEISLPAVQIEDEPRFPYRGMHLDVARHFMPVEFVKKYIDLMSQYKFNQFHWHLTDDQGWRIEIKKYPKLTEIGSKRPESALGRVLVPYVGDGVPVEGFYTQEQIRDVVAYAKARYITVIPEIELPGHASAALAAYPNLSCKADYKYKVQTTWGIFKEVFCPSEETFKFLGDVIDETIALFPDSPYVHIGGDEVLKEQWKESAFVQDLMKRENLKDEHEVQSYFVRRMERYVNSKGKKIIGWDEILEGGLAPNATVMSWRGMKGGIEAAKAKHDVIMTPSDFAYLDYGQGDPAYEPTNIGGYLPLEKVYSFDPVPKELTADEAKYILGGQANIWTEYMQTPSQVEYMAFPRILAIAESVWSTPENKNFSDFSKRLMTQYARLDKQNVNYRIPEPAGLKSLVLGRDDIALIELIPPTGSRIYYTLDGSTPDEKSSLYEKPFKVDIQENERIELKTVVLLSTGRKSSVYAATLLRRDYLKPVELAEKRPGVTYAFEMPAADPAARPLRTSGETKTIAFEQFAKTNDLKRPFAVTFDGYINVSTDGVYEFQVDSTWDTTIVVDGEKLIDDAGTPERKVRSAVAALRAGLHKVSLRYDHRGGEPFWRIRWAIKGQNWRNIGGGELAH